MYTIFSYYLCLPCSEQLSFRDISGHSSFSRVRFSAMLCQFVSLQSIPHEALLFCSLHCCCSWSSAANSLSFFFLSLSVSLFLSPRLPSGLQFWSEGVHSWTAACWSLPRQVTLTVVLSVVPDVASVPVVSPAG